MKFVDNGPIDGLPMALKCGECGASSSPVEWRVFTDESGALLGAMGLVLCKRCGSAVSGLVANDPSVMATLQECAREVFDQRGPVA